jgi:HEAT repeat protein
MPRVPRFTIRRLLLVIAVLAVAMAVLRYPILFVQKWQRFNARHRVGEQLILSYYALGPPRLPGAKWTDAVNGAQIAWCNVVFDPDHIAESEVDAILIDLQGLVARATPATAEGDLYTILDLLAHAKSHASVGYVAMMRTMMKNNVDGEGVPNPAIVAHARAMAGTVGKDPVADLTAALGHADWRVRVMAARAFKEVGLLGQVDEAVVGERHALVDGDALVRELAVESLGEIGPKASAAVPDLIPLLAHDPSVKVRVRAADVLARLEPSGKAIVEPLTGALGDVRPSVRQMAAQSLGTIGPAARSALPVLIDRLNTDTDDDVRSVAAEALGKVGPAADVIFPLTAAYRRERQKGENQVAGKIAEALGPLGPSAAPAIPSLRAALQSDVPFDRCNALHVLGAIGPAAREALPDIHKATHATEPNARCAAILALSRIETDPKALMPWLLAALKDPDDDVAAVAAKACGQLGPAAAEALPALSAAAQDGQRWQAQFQAREALKKIPGP